ncbi:hypothetical protein [Acuticoccus kandeliae]|uniref:hypothetical protein n=1 Tax=Acuticoccus kandeliae TaxID=2073160 RepID=UPI000D3EB2C1|nr:hypothetical protein [Acuticoccus kandeliae]
MFLASAGLLVGLSAGTLWLDWWLHLPPRIGRGLPSDHVAADQVFRERVLAAYPLPVDADVLSARLQAEGFEVDRAGGVARFETSRFPCLLMWRIVWTESDGAVTRIDARYGAVCL